MKTIFFILITCVVSFAYDIKFVGIIKDFNVQMHRGFWGDTYTTSIICTNGIKVVSMGPPNIATGDSVFYHCLKNMSYYSVKGH